MVIDQVLVNEAQLLAGHDSPTLHIAVRKLMAGIRRAKGVAQRGKRPVTIADLGRMLAGLSADRPREARDRALVLVGFAAALRRSELVALDLEDLELCREGLVLTLRRSKTDQEGEGRRMGVPYGAAPGTCPVGAVEEWVKRLGSEAGPLFRRISRHGAIGGRLSAPSVGLIVKRLAAGASLGAGEFTGHSLRSGLATSAAAAGVAERHHAPDRPPVGGHFKEIHPRGIFVFRKMPPGRSGCRPGRRKVGATPGRDIFRVPGPAKRYPVDSGKTSPPRVIDCRTSECASAQ